MSAARARVVGQQLPLFVAAAGMLVVATMLNSRFPAAVAALLCIVEILVVLWWLAGESA